MKRKFKYIDLTYLLTVSGDDDATMKEFIDLFMEEVPKLETKMLEAIFNQDWKSLALNAHTAKSTAAIMGLTDLQHHLKKLELKARNAEDIESYPDDVEYFIDISQKAINELETVVASFSNGN